MRRNEIVVLDPESSDPTWADVSEAVIIPVPEDWEDNGTKSVAELVKNARRLGVLERVEDLPHG